MSYETYKTYNFKPETMALIEKANEIIDDYSSQGYTLTLRQLYYQFVAKGLIENTQLSYNRLGDVITKGRMAGEISWTKIEDNHRTSASPAYVEEDENEVLSGIEYGLCMDFWARQANYVEVWVEKDALLGVVSKACEKFKVPNMACKGYLSASEAWRAGKRFEEAGDAGKNCYLIHLGDHDPSGIDMTRDNGARIEMFAGNNSVAVQRIALNMDQVLQYSPPPNPAKVTDSRATVYIKRFGAKSWELDALSPSVIEKMITTALTPLIDMDKWKQCKAEQTERREVLSGLSTHWYELRPQLVEMMEQ